MEGHVVVVACLALLISFLFIRDCCVTGPSEEESRGSLEEREGGKEGEDTFHQQANRQVLGLR
jgi:hypothetical protein